MKLSRLSALVALVLIGGCGRTGPLKPAAGEALPVKPLLARTTPTPDELLTPPPYAKPDRIDELMRRSEPRQPDPFDLPPPTGGAAPALPAGSDPQPVADDTGPATPQ
jgi:predicted small lipoprotein YifL